MKVLFLSIKKLNRNLILSVQLLFLLFSVSAQEENVILNTHKKSTSVSFELINNLVILPVSINNSDTLRFILDTGINTTLITELTSKDNLTLNYSKETLLQGLGNGKTISAILSANNQINIGKITHTGLDVNVIMEDVFHLSTWLGMDVHGIIGYPVFKNFIVELNYASRTLTFHKPSEFNLKQPFLPWQKPFFTLPLIINETKPYIIGHILQENGSRIPVKLLIDTGASHALWLDSFTHDKIATPDNTFDAYLGSGLNGDMNGKVGRIPGFELGPFAFEEVLVAYPDSLSIANAMGIDSRNGSMGAEILRRFNVILNYPENEIYLQPNAYYKNPFAHNKSGCEISAPMPGLPVYVVSKIRPNSPADKAGLKREDQLLYINNQNVVKLTLQDINEIFRGKDGKKIKITADREGEKLSFSFILKDPLAF